jgi:hypothetical protein
MTISVLRHKNCVLRHYQSPERGIIPLALPPLPRRANLVLHQLVRFLLRINRLFFHPNKNARFDWQTGRFFGYE